MFTKQDTKLQLQQNSTFELQVMISVHCDYRSLSPSLCMFIFSKSSIINSIINRYYFYNKKTTYLSQKKVVFLKRDNLLLNRKRISTAFWCVKVSSTRPMKQSLRPWQDQPQGPLWTFSQECDYETIMFPHRPSATHFLHPGGEFALPSVWSLLFYQKEMNIYSPSPHWTSTRCLTLKEAEIVKPIFQGNMQWLAQSHPGAGSQFRLQMMSWCPREHRVCGGEGEGREQAHLFW